MSDVLDRKTFKVGENIFKEGEPGSVAYVIQSGEVEITKTIDGEDKVLATIGQGGIFGEMALIDEQPRMAAARAAKPSTIIVVTKGMFDRKLAKTDPFVRGLLHIFVDTIRRTS